MRDVPDDRAPGWYPAPDDVNEEINWDGQEWTARRRWTAAGFVEVPMRKPEPRLPAAAPRSRRVPGAAAWGVVITTVGTVLVILGFTQYIWISFGPFDADFGSIRRAAPHDPHWVRRAYFGWLGYTVLVLGAGAAYGGKVARLPPVLRVVGAALGAIGAGLTFVALTTGDRLSHTLPYSGAGFWLAIFGFILIGIGSLTG